MTQSEMYKLFDHLVGVPADVKATGILFSQQVAAIEVEIPNQTMRDPPSPIPQPQNDFAHITLWCARGTEAYEANELPRHFQSAKAKKVIV